MRNQRRGPVTVQLVFVTTTDDHLGNEVETTITKVVHNAIFEPGRKVAFAGRIVQRAGESQAPVFEPAAFNVPGQYELSADDRVVSNGVTWYVVGGSTIWLDRTNVPVSRTRER